MGLGLELFPGGHLVIGVLLQAGLFELELQVLQLLLLDLALLFRVVGQHLEVVRHFEGV